jgi:hypothetical protein
MAKQGEITSEKAFAGAVSGVPSEAKERFVDNVRVSLNGSLM